MLPKQVIDSAVALATALNSSEEWEQNSEKSVKSTKDKSQEILEEKYSIFWTPDLEQQKMIDSWDEDFRIKMIDAKLIYREDITGLGINWKMFYFDKNQPITEFKSWNDNVDEIKKIKRKWLDMEELKSLVKLLKWKQEVLNLTHHKFWTFNNAGINYDTLAWVADFDYGDIYRNSMSITFGSICTIN